MTTCEHIHDQLLDFLYGLLEEDESANVRAHLASCLACQEALARAQGQRQAIARAAQACRDVKPFVAPDFDTPLAQPAAAPLELPTQVQPTLPTPSATPVKPRSSRWMRFGALAVAASLLVAVVLGQAYFSGLDRREKELVQAKQDLRSTEAAFVNADKSFEENIKALPAKLSGKAIHLQVSTPAQYDPQAPTSCVVQTTDLVGQPSRAKVQIKALDKASGKELAKQVVECAGLQTVQLPAGLTAESGQVVFEASAQAKDATVQVKVDVRQVRPGYVTHLATNKSAYRVGDLLFFRTVTLERFSLKPVAKAMPLRFSLVSLDGKTAKQLPVSETGAGGIGGGEFALTDDLPSGVYYLEVAAQNTGAVLQKRRLEIIRDTTPQFVLDRDQYHEGESAKVTAIDRKLGGPVANRDIAYRQVDPRGRAVPGMPLQQTRTNNQGQADLPVPGNLNSTKEFLELEIRDGKKYERVIQPIPVVPSKVAVDFFPEGGELIDGLPTRVYYRVSSLQGEPVVPRGKIIFRSSQGVIFESPVGQASGVFAFTPSSTESYAVRVTDPHLEIVHSNPIDRLGIQPTGLVLGIPNGVTKAGEPIRVSLGNKGDAKRLVILVSCRGQIIEHQTLEVSAGRTELQLNPSTDVAGVLRVTVYQAKADGLTPLAERLIFRMPAHRLELTASTDSGKLESADRGQRTQLNIKGTDEKKKAAGFWALACVIDAKVKSEKERDLPTHFYLMGDVPNDDLEQAHVMVRDDAVSRQALDVYLGAQGWRRFAADTGPAMYAKLQSDEAGAAEGQKQAQLRRGAALAPALLSLENASLVQLRALHEARLAKAVSSMRDDAVKLRNDLAGQQQTQAALCQSLADALFAFRELPRLYLRQAMGLVVLLCLALGAMLLLAGLVKLLRQRQATAIFAGSFATLGLCMLVYVAARQISDEPATGVEKIRAAMHPWPSVAEVQIAQAPEAQVDSHMLPAGQYPITENLEPTQERGKNVLREQMAMATAAAKGNGAGTPADGAYLSNQLPGGGFGGQAKAMPKRFETAENLQNAGGGGAPSPLLAPVAPPPRGAKLAEPKTKLEKKVDSQNQSPQAAVDAVNGQQLVQTSPYVWSKQANPDTLLWVPALDVPSGTAQLSFELPNQPAQYRVIVHGHTADGRLGYFEGMLNVK